MTLHINTKVAISQELDKQGTLLICAQCATVSAPYLKGFKSYCKKCSFLTHFKILAHFPFKTIVVCCYWVVRIRLASGKGNIHMKFPFKTSFQDHCTRFNGKTHTKYRFGSFQNPCLSLITGQWQVDSSCSNHQSLTGILKTSN